MISLRYLSLAAAALTTTALATLLAVPAQAQVVNGSFEQGTFTNGQSLAVGSTAISNWTVTNAEVQIIGNESYGLASPYGNYFLDLTSLHDSLPYGGVTQNIATTIGTSYSLAFSLGTNQDNPGFSGPVSATASAGGTSQSFTFTPAVGSAGNQWGMFGLNFVATSGSTPISIVGTGAAGPNFLGLDNVSLTPSPAAVPEASTPVSLGLLLALGMGTVVFARKKRVGSAA